ncbi:MAG: class I SAM-dependent methyltransferase [Pseudomonadota bacterium]
MAGFDPSWLALREPADGRARSTDLIAKAGALLGGQSAPLVCDLGAGTGAAARAFAVQFPSETRWVLVDGDAACLAVAGQTLQAAETRLVDLSLDLSPWPPTTSLVTATALFDLANADWIRAFAARLVKDRLPILSCLTFDGLLSFEPTHPDDDLLVHAFRTHQCRDKGLGGPAAGPDAGRVLAEELERLGYQVELATTPWELTAERDGELIAALLDGYVQAARDLDGVPESTLVKWLSARKDHTARHVVGHVDLLAIPI